jgi:hypothetical protein
MLKHLLNPTHTHTHNFQDLDSEDLMHPPGQEPDSAFKRSITSFKVCKHVLNPTLILCYCLFNIFTYNICVFYYMSFKRSITSFKVGVCVCVFVCL